MSTMQRTFILRGDTQAQALWAFLKVNWRALAEQGKALAVVVSPHKAKGTDAQRAKFHALIGDIAEKAWVKGRQFEASSWKEFIKRKFLGTEDHELPDGTIEQRARSTEKLDVEGYSDLITKTEAYAASELGLEL